MLGDEKVNLIEKFLNKIQNNHFKNQCLCDHTTIFYNSARIINNLNIRSAIKIGSNSHIKGELLVFGHGGEISIGSYCYVGENSRIWSAKKIEIGDRVLISHDVNIFDNLIHPIDPELRYQQFLSIITIGQPKEISTLEEKEIHIGNDVLIGAKAIILRGVTIGGCSIVGAGSVVTNDIPPNSIVAGNPAQTIREIPESKR